MHEIIQRSELPPEITHRMVADVVKTVPDWLARPGISILWQPGADERTAITVATIRNASKIRQNNQGFDNEGLIRAAIRREAELLQTTTHLRISYITAPKPIMTTAGEIVVNSPIASILLCTPVPRISGGYVPRKLEAVKYILTANGCAYGSTTKLDLLFADTNSLIPQIHTYGERVIYEQASDGEVEYIHNSLKNPGKVY